MGRLEVQVVERRGQRKLDDEEGHGVRGGEHREGPGCDLRASDPEARGVVPRSNDHLRSTHDFAKEVSGKIYKAKNCTDEAFGIVRFVNSGDGVEASLKLHQKHSQRTKEVQAVAGDPSVGDEVEPYDEGSTMWHQHLRITENGSLIDEQYSAMREKVVLWRTNAAENEGGAVAMDVGIVEGGGGEEDEWEEDHESECVDAVYPATRCYHCQVYGHMARECPAKGKGKGGAKGGGKEVLRGGVKGG